MAFTTAMGYLAERIIPCSDTPEDEISSAYTFFPENRDYFDDMTGEDLLFLIQKEKSFTMEYLYEAHIRGRRGAIHRAASILGPEARSIMENLNGQVLKDSINIVQNTPDGLVYLKKFLTDTYELLILGSNQRRIGTPLSEQQYAEIEEFVNGIARDVHIVLAESDSQI